MAFNPTEAIWKRRDKGDIAIFYRWDNDEPVMTLYPRFPSAELRPSGVDLPLSTAYTLADSKTGEPTPGLLQRLERAAIALGMFPDKFTCHRIADAIVDGLPDLVAMPPFPPPGFDPKEDARKQVVGEGLIKVAGRELWRDEVTVGDMQP